MFPIRHDNLWALYEQHLASFWVASEVDFEGDVAHFEALKPAERAFILRVLAFFAGSDGVVCENLSINFEAEVQAPEARAFYAVQSMMEVIHSHTYALMIDRLVRDADHKRELFGAIHTDPAIGRKADWALKWMNRARPFGERLVAFACLEGIHFSAAFAAIFWLKKRGVCPGLAQANALISRDEGLHTNFAVAVFKMLADKPDADTVVKIVREAVEVEEAFVAEALPVAVIGMNADVMQQYVRFVADRLVYDLIGEKIYNAENPLSWMDQISLEAKNNFFEKKVTEYQFNIMAKPATLGFDEDF